MTRNNMFTGLAKVLWLLICATTVVVFVLGIRWGFDYFAASSSMIGSLVYSLLAPFGVVLFALLVEQIGGREHRIPTPNRLDVRYTRCDAK